jgi:hypothetical protein
MHGDGGVALAIDDTVDVPLGKGEVCTGNEEIRPDQ